MFIIRKPINSLSLSSHTLHGHSALASVTSQTSFSSTGRSLAAKANSTDLFEEQCRKTVWPQPVLKKVAEDVRA